MVKTGGQTRWYGPVSAVVPGAKGYLKISPNPFREKTVISYRLPVISEQSQLVTDYGLPITLKIYDVSGRLVKDLSLPTAYSLLPTVAIWDGRDDRNKLLTPGIYFCVLKTPDCVKREKILLVK